MTVKDFLGELASESPAPGGGSVAALCGAAAAALCAMVSRLTVGREKYRAAWEEMAKITREADVLRMRFLQLVDEDTDAFLSFMAARKLLKSTEAEWAARDTAIAEATLRSARVPLETLKAMAAVSRLAALAVEKGNSASLTDAGTAAQMARAGAIAAAYNVRINLPSIHEGREREDLAVETSRALSSVLEQVTRVEGAIDERMRDRSGI
jgi:glutamate formiminotransferase/formiminotetrahydrofolate cyclodeaminase